MFLASLTKRYLLLLLQRYTARSKKEKTITRGCISRYLQRHPEFQLKEGKLLDRSRAEACTQGNMQPWFEVYEDLIINEKDDIHLFFNLDETSVNVLNRVNKKIFERTESPIIPVLRKPSRFASITLVLCIAA